VVIIAVFYTADVSWPMLGLGAATLCALAALNGLRVERLLPYLALGAVLWYVVLQSGIHATLAGVALACTIPLRRTPGRPEASECPLIRLEHGLQPWVAFAIVPIFGFANAGVSFAGLALPALLEPVPLGVALGLFVGKQIGVFVFAWAAIRMRLADLPANATWAQLYGVAILCGIGFTMSLFIGLLAFPSSAELQDAVKIGVLAGSAASALAGAALLLVSKCERVRAPTAA
jgi:NhaA family Na+:H+ antiporter